ncbi:MAG: DDE-type integrase/transposase/recombinase [Limnohabitans sp.]|nr:DDE-type integrase/transposase/recombinase [Limnohabitans sp.]
MAEVEKVLAKIYYDVSGPAGFSSPYNLYKESSKYINISLKDVKHWLKSQNPYTLHRQRVYKFTRSRVIASKINEQFQADIVDMQEFSRYNNGYKYILTVIDVFSKFAFAKPLKTKSSKEVLLNFKRIFKTRKPLKIQTDNGKEFKNNDLLNYLKSENIIFFTSNNFTIKCTVVERLNRTLKSKMWKYFTAKGTRKWVDVIDKIIQGYNNSFHRSIQCKPIDVTEDNTEQIFKKLYGFDNLRELLKSTIKNIDYKIGDKIRIPYDKNTFHKSYYPLWKDNIYYVSRIKNSYPVKQIKVKDEEGRELKQSFYKHELQKINKSAYRIEKIIKKRNIKGEAQYLVKWLGYPSSYNSWEPEDNIELLKNG